MPAVVYDTDVLVHVIQSLEDRTIGHDSPFSSEAHPGSNKLIEGWKWDLRHWPAEREFKGMENAPSLWDPSVSGLDTSSFQSGYGDNDDLLLLDVESFFTDTDEIWSPRINHGYFYIQEEERYLFSDDYQAEYFSSQDVISGMQYVDLTYRPKVGTPILVRQYEFDRVLGRFVVSLDARKKVAFSTSATGPEFITDTDYDPYRLWLDDDYSELVGTPITLVSGIADPAVVSGLELVGYGDNTADQEFRTQFSPLDPLADIEVWGYIDPTMPRQWDVISGLDDFTVSGLEVKVDRDLGVLRFGDHDLATSTGAGIRPKKGERIIIYYTKGIAAFYEPEKTRDYLLAPTANVNPVVSAINRGFVLLSVAPDDPATVLLTAEDLPGTPNPTFLIEMGNNIGRLVATVKNAASLPLEGQEVTFEMLSPVVGGFGSQLITTALTSLLGEAKTIYNPPTTINDIGQATDNVSHEGPDTVMSVDGLTDPGTVSGLYLYKVHSDDPVLGIAEDEVTGYYEDYLDEEEITSGQTATVPWEQEYRTREGLGLPTTYESGDLTTGKKTIILTNERADVIDPHTGDVEPSAPYPLGPLYPSTILATSIVGNPRLDLRFNNRWLPLPPDDGTKAYFVVGDAQTRIRAYVTNQRTGKRIYSNTIGMRITIPDTANGTYFAETLADVPTGLLFAPQDVDGLSDGTIDATSGVGTNYEDYVDERYWHGTVSGFETYREWYRRTRRGDTTGLELAGLGPTSVSVDPGAVPGEIPLGFRLKSDGITLASVLDQITYLDPNDNLPSGYFGV
jgi:hypothetical protein